jgi:hypothetical protein
LKRIREQYGGDLAAMAAATKEVERRVLEAVGDSPAAQYIKRKEAQSRRFGNPDQMTEVLPFDGESGYVIDRSAWVVNITEADADLIRVSVTLDPTRYREIMDVDPKLALRGKAADDVSRAKVISGADVPGLITIPLAFRKEGPRTFATELRLPRAQRNLFLLQVMAEIEPGWKAGALREL